MTKTEFMALLSEQLAALPDVERKDALEYYEEYFDAAGPDREAQTIAELGSPEEVARKILEEQGAEPGPARAKTESAEDNRSPLSKSKFSWKIRLVFIAFVVLLVAVQLIDRFGVRITDGKIYYVADSESTENALTTYYDQLLACKAEGYEDMTLTEFNTTLLAVDPNASELMRIRALAMEEYVSSDSPDHDFFAVTLAASVKELYDAQNDENTVLTDTLTTVKLHYVIRVEYAIDYIINDPETLSVGKRDQVLRQVQSGLQEYIDAMEEDTIHQDDNRTTYRSVSQGAAQLSERLSTSQIQLTCTIKNVETTFFTSREAYSDYMELIAHKVDNYADMSTADFNATLVPKDYTLEELDDLGTKRSYALSLFAPGDADYDFFAYTLKYSLNDLLRSSPSQAVTMGSTALCRYVTDGTTTYSFNARYEITYSIPDPGAVTVSQRDNTLKTLETELETYYTDTLSDTELLEGTALDTLNAKAAELTDGLSTDALPLSCRFTSLQKDKAE